MGSCRCGECRSHGKANGMFHDLIDVFINVYRPEAKAKLALFRRMTLDEAVEHAALACDGRRRRFSHQRRLTRRSLDQAWSRLQAMSAQIEQCFDFDELLGTIESACAGIKGLGELYCYDTALRIGAQRSIAPAYVYLHRGTRVGARNLGVNARARYLRLSDLPPEFRRLAPHEIEDFLCIFKDDMTRFNSKGSPRSGTSKTNFSRYGRLTVPCLAPSPSGRRC